MSVTEPRWVDVATFATYLGLSEQTVYRLTRRDPAVQRVTRRFGRRVQICLAAWREGEERRMSEGGA